VGGGAAGLMAAGRAAECGACVITLEKENSPSLKLLQTGNGRCNLSNLASAQELTQHLGPQGRFMRNAFVQMASPELRALLARLGIQTVSDELGRVYPASGRAQDVRDALVRYATGRGAELRTCAEVVGLRIDASRVQAVQLRSGEVLTADAVILATGGRAWTRCQAESSGYALAAMAGHTQTPLAPGLVPLVVREAWVAQLEGISLESVTLRAALSDGHSLEQNGALVFTRDGISGPAALNLSNRLALGLRGGPLGMTIDLLPNHTREQIMHGIFVSQTNNKLSDATNNLQALLPRRLCQQLEALLQPEMPGQHLSRHQCERVISLIKGLSLTVVRTRSFREAMVTVGGVACEGIEPRSMASRLCGGLYLVGELLDLAGDTGGFNLQIAFSSGWVAGSAAVVA